MSNPAELTWYDAASPARARLVLGHGAGAGQHSAFMTRAARALASRHIAVATFDFPYMAARRRVPDKAPILEEAWRSAIRAAHHRETLAALPLFIGGKSMGGRIASHVASQGAAGVAGLVFFGYPLHPPGRPQQRRDAHLPAIAEPMLFIQGERDEFGTAGEIRELLPRLNPRVSLHTVPAGDHSFKVPASAGRAPNAVFDDVIAAAAAWIRSISAAL